MYYGSNSAFLRSVTGRKLTLSSNYVSIRSVYDFSISICYYIPLYHTWHFLYLFVWRGFMEANTYHPILNISVVPRRYFSFTDLMFTVHSTITIIGSLVTNKIVAKMSLKALHSIALHCHHQHIIFRSHHLAESVQRRLREQDSHLKQVVFQWVPTIGKKLILNNSIRIS